MSRYQVDKFLRDVCRDDKLAARWRTDAENAFGGYDLSPAEREALKAWDVRRLYDMGANPLLLLISSNPAGKSIPGYIAAIRNG
jgi:hypothetical protein